MQFFLVLVLTEHGVIISKFGFDLFFIVLDLRHETHIDEAVNLMLLILRPNVLRSTLFFIFPFCLHSPFLFHNFPLLLSFFTFLGLIFLTFLLLFDPLRPEIILKKLLLMSFKDLMLLDLMFWYFFNNLFDDCHIDSPALNVTIDIIIGVPIRV